MPHYLIESPHTAEDCLKAIDHVLAAGYLTHFQWGCPDGEHTGYLIMEAGSKAEATLVVPTFIRNRARVIELTQFSVDQVKAIHKMKE